MSDFWGQPPSPNNQQPWSQLPPQSSTQQPWGQPSLSNNPPLPTQQPWGQPSLSNNPPLPTQQPWGQPSSNANWQQQPLYPGQFQPVQPPQKKKRNKLWILLGIVGCVLVLSCTLCGIVSSFSKTSNTDSTAVDTSTEVVQTVQPTPTPAPTKTQAQIKEEYEASTISTTVTELYKAGSDDQGKDVHFTGTIAMFVKDETGHTTGANVDEQNLYSSSYVQVIFTDGTDITRLNERDILEIWGNVKGVFSGTNAYGGTVQVIVITGKYMNDQTTDYQVGN